MASIDGGHYFLTVLAPVRDHAKDGAFDQSTAPMIQLRDLLANMPTAMQTPGSTMSGVNSPFAKSELTHFVRFSVISQLGYNGVQSPDPIMTKLQLTNPVTRYDHLDCHFLLFAAEFDAPSGSQSRDLAVYLREIWDVMEEDLREVFSHCVGFDDETVSTAAEFIDYIKKCEIETTMPFNFYWAEEPELPALSGGGLALRVGLATVAAGGGLWALLRFGVDMVNWLAILFGIVAGIIAAILALGAILRSAGDKPFPTPPGSSLKNILKAMFLQHQLTHFAVNNQANDADALYDNFGDFLDRVKPSETAPSHPAGQAVSEEDHA